jgi:hypothetical protein
LMTLITDYEDDAEAAAFTVAQKPHNAVSAPIMAHVPRRFASHEEEQ